MDEANETAATRSMPTLVGPADDGIAEQIGLGLEAMGLTRAEAIVAIKGGAVLFNAAKQVARHSPPSDPPIDSVRVARGALYVATSMANGDDATLAPDVVTVTQVVIGGQCQCGRCRQRRAEAGA